MIDTARVVHGQGRILFGGEVYPPFLLLSLIRESDMRLFIRVLPLVLVLLLSGCSEPTIDASSEEAFYRSAGRMAEALPPQIARFLTRR